MRRQYCDIKFQRLDLYDLYDLNDVINVNKEFLRGRAVTTCFSRFINITDLGIII